VVTTFVAQSYSSLSPDYSKSTAMAIYHLSAQWNDSSVGPLSAPTEFIVGPSDIRVNTLWFISLVLSLFSALLGIIIKQWVHEYMKWTDGMPGRDTVVLRTYRLECWKQWRVYAWLMALPALLQLSVVLFLCGLADLLWNLNHTVAIPLIVVITLVLSLVGVTTGLPVFCRSCPYRTPSGMTILRIVHLLFKLTSKPMAPTMANLFQIVRSRFSTDNYRLHRLIASVVHFFLWLRSFWQLQGPRRARSWRVMDNTFEVFDPTRGILHSRNAINNIMASGAYYGHPHDVDLFLRCLYTWAPQEPLSIEPPDLVLPLETIGSLLGATLDQSPNGKSHLARTSDIPFTIRKTFCEHILRAFSIHVSDASPATIASAETTLRTVTKLSQIAQPRGSNWPPIHCVHPLYVGTLLQLLDPDNDCPLPIRQLALHLLESLVLSWDPDNAQEELYKADYFHWSQDGRSSFDCRDIPA
jgi:hypothetical protein